MFESIKDKAVDISNLLHKILKYGSPFFQAKPYYVKLHFRNALTLTMPEETLVLSAPTPSEKVSIFIFPFYKCL